MVPRPGVIAAPILLTFLLGWLAYTVACPCQEDGIAFFYGLWAYYFAVPGVVAVGLAVLTRRALARAGPRPSHQ
jgi:hypothetical protein